MQQQAPFNPGQQPGYAEIPNGSGGYPQGYAPPDQQMGYAPQQAQNQYAAPPVQMVPPNGGYAAPGQQQYAEPPQQPADTDYDEGKLGAIFGKDVAFDIKAKLKMPDKDDNSAQMEGKYSVYGLTLTKTVGQQKMTVRANLEWIDILGMFATALKFAFRPSGARSINLNKDVMANLATAQQAALYALGAVQQGQNAMQPVMDANGYLSNALAGLGAAFPDYELDQVKVIPNNLTPDGYSQVTSCKIQRTGFRSDGSPSRYPWTVMVENFEAIKVVKPNGTTTYNPKTKRPGKGGGQPITAFASDRDILKLSGKAMRHLLVWDVAANLTRVKNGIVKQAEKFARRRA